MKLLKAQSFFWEKSNNLITHSWPWLTKKQKNIESFEDKFKILQWPIIL